MEKVTLEEEFIVQEKIPSLSIESMVEENMADKDAQIQAILSKTNYAALMHEFISNLKVIDLYIRVSPEVRKAIGGFRRTEVNHAVRNKTFAFQYWNLNHVLVFGYSKDKVVLEPHVKKPNTMFAILVALWVVDVVCTGFFGFLFIVTGFISWYLQSQMFWLNLSVVVSFLAMILLGIMAWPGMLFVCWFCDIFISLDHVDIEKIEALPLLNFTEEEA